MPLRVNKEVPIWIPPAPEPSVEGLSDSVMSQPTSDISSMAVAGQRRNLPVPMFEQLQDNWCWAACIQMVMAFFKSKVCQCEVVRILFDDRDCCASQKSCDEGCDPKDVEEVLKNDLLQITCRHHAEHISFNDIMNEINDNRPIAVAIMWFTKPNGVQNAEQIGGHLIIVKGWRIINNRQFVKVNDPFYGPGDVLYSKLLKYYGPTDDELDGVWKHTWTKIQRG